MPGTVRGLLYGPRDRNVIRLGNRCFIMVQIPEKIDSQDYSTLCEIGKERIRRAGAQIAAGDTGFRVFKLDSSNLKTWDAAPIDPQAGDVIGELTNRMNAMIHRVKPDRSDLGMVFEVMLKLGVPPTHACLIKSEGVPGGSHSVKGRRAWRTSRMTFCDEQTRTAYEQQEQICAKNLRFCGHSH